MEVYDDAVVRMATFLDTRSVVLSMGTAREIDGAVNRFINRWRRRRRFGQRVMQVRRLYAPEEHRQVSTLLGHSMKWRQGGNGEAMDLTNFIINDSRAFCLQDPGRSTAVLCSTDVGIRDTIEELPGSGAEVFVPGRAGNLPAYLSGLVKPENTGLF